MNKQSDDSINARIQEVMEHFNLNKNSFSKALGLSNNVTIGNIVGGRKGKPSFDILQKIILNFDSINSEWLLTGEGDMLKSVPKISGLTEVKEEARLYSTKTPDVSNIPIVTQDISENTTIPLVDIKAAASYNTGYLCEGYIEELPPFSFPVHLINGGRQYYAFQVMGDSMHPTLYNNDYVVAAFCQPNDWLSLKDGYIYVIVTESRGIVIKRLLNRLQEHRFLRARSDNRSHPAFNIEAEDILQIWEVKCKISFNMPNENESLYNMVMELKDDVERLKEK